MAYIERLRLMTLRWKPALRAVAAAPALRSAPAIVGLLLTVFLASSESQAQSALKQLFEKVPGLAAPSQSATTQADQGAGQPTPPANQPTDQIPPPTIEGRLPPVGASGDGKIDYVPSAKAGMIDMLVVRDYSLSQVLDLLGQTQGLNIVAANDIDAVISVTLRDVPVEEALTAILQVANYTWVRRNNIILVTSMTNAANLPADTQGRQIQVFELNFASATDVEKVITSAGFLSPLGKISINESVSSDNRRTREVVVVEDLPYSVARVAEYIAQVDQPPRQVLIEAHILQVTLDDTNEQGVDLGGLLRIANAGVRIQPTDLTELSTGFSSDAPRAFLATLQGGDVNAVIKLLQTMTDAKTLGSPKLLVLNGQEARIQIGQTIYFSQVTTTQTSTQQGAGSIETGVIMQITPRITRDGRVLLNVAPEVSAAGERGSPELPPDTTTTKLETDVMLEDGQGIVIGGLIEERDSIAQSKVPWLGDVKGLGWFFRRSIVTKERKEIIVALVPRIQPYAPQWQAYEQGELAKVTVPLFDGPLCRTDRPWDPILPDGYRVYTSCIPRRAPYYRPTGGEPLSIPSYVVPAYPLPEQRFDSAACEPTEMLPTPAANNGFLSDQAAPAISNQHWQKGAVISDQN
jgi:type IV pilus assembly protein PilQ